MAFGNVTYGSATYGGEEPSVAIAVLPDPAKGLVPLAVRIGNRVITRELSGLQFREEAVGGLKSISLRLSRPLDKFDRNLDHLSEIVITDGRTAETIAAARLTDLGRSASADDGQQWDLVGFGPGNHAADKEFPYVLVDTSLEPFTRSTYSTPNASTQSHERDEDNPSLLLSVEEGKTASLSLIGDMIHRGFKQAGMKLARVRCRIDAGDTDIDWNLQLVTRTGAGGGTVVDTATANTAAAILSGVVVTDFTNGHNVCSVRITRDGSPQVAGEVTWFEFWEVVLRALLLDETGTEITTGYTQNYVLAHEVAKDLVGRILDQFDGTLAVIDTNGTYQIDQLSYPDGVTAEQVLEELMILEPAYHWWAEANPAGGGYIFHWGPWPTTVRYEVTIVDGGDFPASSRELYNEVTVRWRDKNGRTRTTAPITMACAVLDNAGVTQSRLLDLGDEIGSSAAATRAGESFLADHNVPANAGTLTVSRPIRDLLTGRLVQPFEIKAAALIRVRGVESYQDALNPSSNDGQTVFRIWTKTYNLESNSSALELDIPSRTTTNALRRLAKRSALGPGKPRKR